ncbi:MAG: hypothetical protein ACYC44_01345 [Patescibacteria group bacterium]
MPDKRFEILPNQPEVSKKPETALPLRYTRYKPTEEPLKSAIGHESHKDADQADLWTFEVNNPFYRERVEDILDSRVRTLEATGVTVDLVLLKIVANRLAKGLVKGSDEHLSIYQFIADRELYETLLSYLDHLSKLKVEGADELRQKIHGFQGLTKEQIDLLSKYLLEREKYLEK